MTILRGAHDRMCKHHAGGDERRAHEPCLCLACSVDEAHDQSHRLARAFHDVAPILDDGAEAPCKHGPGCTRAGAHCALRPCPLRPELVNEQRILAHPLNRLDEVVEESEPCRLW